MDGMCKLGWAMLVMGVVLWVLNKYVFDLSDIADWITNSLPWYLAAATLFASEIVVGFLPPDLFILWAQSLTYPWLMVLLLSVLSYLAGIVSYLIG